MPSDLLARQPDVREAEDLLIAANARIGVAKAHVFSANHFDRLFGRPKPRSLTDLFTGPARLWNGVLPNFDAPIFNAGRLRANVRLTEAEQREALANYEKTIETAFREVSDALIGYAKTRGQREQEELLVKALQETDRLSTPAYQGNLDGYLQVLVAEQNLFQGQLNLAELQTQELLSVVQLYRALGGGWQ